jgi:hypothetical protein
MKGVFGNEGALRFLFQDVVERGEQMRNGFFGFVAHVGETKRFAAEFAVTGIDDEVMSFAQAFRKIDNVDVPVVRDAGECF